jgi:hypothetical protein
MIIRNQVVQGSSVASGLKQTRLAENVVAKHARDFDALGAQYEIIINGKVFTNVPNFENASEYGRTTPIFTNEFGHTIGGRAPKRKKVKRNFRQTGYIEKLKALRPGEKIQIFTAPYKPAEMQRVVCSVASRCYGPGNYTTSVNGSAIDVMRASKSA